MSKGAPDRFWRDSAIRDSILHGYVDVRSSSSVADREAAFTAAADAFRREAVAAFTFPSFDDKDKAIPAIKHELTRHYILRALLFVGYNPDDISFGLVARLVEMRVKRPDMTFPDMFGEISAKTGIPCQTLDKDLERSFGYYDNAAIDRVHYLTGTFPMSARDIVCDLAVHIKTELIDEVYGGR